MPDDLDNELIFQKAFGTAELAGLSVEQRAIYEENLIQYWGMKSALETAVEDRLVENATNRILKSYDNNIIADLTGLSIEQIGKLRAERF